jgi:hypothetical protein
MDLDLDGEDQWWFNLITQKVEKGSGAPNMERMGPYATEEEAAHALATAAERTEAWDADDEKW